MGFCYHRSAIVKTLFPRHRLLLTILFSDFRGLGVPNFSSILKFRISGQGKTFFGDGLALWITHTAFFNEGEMHGSEEKYFGIGIIFDTFKNTENLAAHR